MRVPVEKHTCHMMCFLYEELAIFARINPGGDLSVREDQLRCFAGLRQFGTCVKEDEIKANKNHIKEYYSLTAISLQFPVKVWWIPHLVQWMV